MTRMSFAGQSWFVGVGVVSLVLAGGCRGDSSGDDEVAGTESESSAGSESESGTEAGGSESSGTEATETGSPDPPRPDRLVVTADWRAHRLSLVDYGALRDGAESREAALWKSVELPDHEPGPLEVELTPDGGRAVVAVAPGFFAGSAGALIGAGPGSIPEGGSLLVVELDSGEILAELDTAQHPMGIVISPDGARAWTANYGGNGEMGSTVSEIDLDALSVVADYEVGPNPEQLDLDPAGELAIVNTAGDGGVRLFATADPGGTLSSSLMVSGDPSWVLLLDDGSERAVSTNSLGPPGYSLIDVADPGAPALIEQVEFSGVPYAGAPGLAPNELIMTALTGTEVALLRYDLDSGEILQQIAIPGVGFPLGLAVDPSDELALVPMPGINALAVIDLTTEDVRILDWQDAPGPTYLALE